MRWYFIYYAASSFTVLLPLTFAMKGRSRLDPDLRLFGIFLAVTTLYVALMVILASLRQNNLWLWNCYLPVEVGLVMWILSTWISRATTQRWLRASIIAFVAIWLIEILTAESIHAFSRVSRPLQGAIFIVGSSLVVFEKHNDPERLLSEVPAFWVCCGLLLYYTPTLLLYAVAKGLISRSTDILRSGLLLTPAITIMSNILFTKALRCPSPR